MSVKNKKPSDLELDKTVLWVTKRKYLAYINGTTCSTFRCNLELQINEEKHTHKCMSANIYINMTLSGRKKGWNKKKNGEEEETNMYSTQQTTLHKHPLTSMNPLSLGHWEASPGSAIVKLPVKEWSQQFIVVTEKELIKAPITWHQVYKWRDRTEFEAEFLTKQKEDVDWRGKTSSSSSCVKMKWQDIHETVWP